jgi:hypothetical protein
VNSKEFRVLSPAGILGYGFPAESFMRGIALRPHLVACDAGSTDPGPYYLGSGKSFTNRAMVKRDLRFMLVEGLRCGATVVVGSAGGSGAAPHLAWCREILEEVAHEERLSFTLGVIHSDVSKETVKGALRAGKIRPLPFVPELTEEAIDASTYIVAQIGNEPLMAALKAGCNVVLAGRCYDPANFAALPILLGYDAGLALHMGKILECGAIAATPGSGSDCAFATLRDDCFVLEALNPMRRFTRESAAAHTLYEKSDPCHLPGPGGMINLDNCRFTELDNGRVEVRGSRFEASSPYRVKLEGARPTGYRAISVAGIRDPILIGCIDEVLAKVEEQVATIVGRSVQGSIRFRVYGKNGVMGSFEPVEKTLSHELGLVIEVNASTADEADSLLSTTRSTLLHYGYPGRIATAGNLAFPFSPSDVNLGKTFEFSIYHLMDLDAPDQFPLEIQRVDGGRIVP